MRGNSLPTVTNVTMTSGSLAGQLWTPGTSPAVQRADGLMLRVDFSGPRLAISSIAFSPTDDNQFVVGDVCGGVFVFHLGKNQFSLVARFAAPVNCLSWIDTAGHIACVCGASAYVVDVSTARSTSKPMQGPHKRPITRIAVPVQEPRGILTLVSGDSLSVWRAQDLQCLKMISASTTSFTDAAMSEEAIYAIEGFHTLRCWTTAAFTHLETMTMREFHFVKLECTSRQLLAATDNGTIVVFGDRSLGSATCAVHMMTTSQIVSLVVNRLPTAQSGSDNMMMLEDAETIFGCVQSDGVVSFASLPAPKNITEKTAANLILSFRAMPSGSGGHGNANFRMMSVFNNKELKFFHLPTSKAAYDKLAESGGKPPPLNTFVSFVQRRGVTNGTTRPNWINTGIGAGEADVGRKGAMSMNQNASSASAATAASSSHQQQQQQQRSADNLDQGLPPTVQSPAVATSRKNYDKTAMQPHGPKTKPKFSSDPEIQPTRENALRDRMPAPTVDTMKQWMKVNLLNSAEATPMNSGGSPVIVGDFAAKVVSDRNAAAANKRKNSTSASRSASASSPINVVAGITPSSTGNESTLSSSGVPNVATLKRPEKFQDTSTVEGILGLRPLLDATSRQQNLDKLRSLLMRYGSFPEQYRGLIWRFLLCLPEKATMSPYYALLASRGNHTATPSLMKPFPLPEGKLRTALNRALSCLAHHAPPFTVAHFIPATVFPLLHVFGSDCQSVVETALAFYINWGKEFFLYYPHMPVSISSFISQTLQNEDRELYEHFCNLGLGPEHFVWEPMMALYTEVLSTNEWLQVMDHTFANAPLWLFLFHVRWLIQMRALLLRVNDSSSMLTFFHKATPFDLNICIQQTYRLQSRYLKNDVTAMYEHLETFPVDPQTNSVVYPVEFDIHESVIFTKQEQIKEIEDHEQQMKIAERRAATAERQKKEVSMLEEAFVRRQRALVEAKFDAANSAWEQKVLLERERQRLRDVEHEARLHAVQEQLRSANRIENLQQELGAAADTEEHSRYDRDMESEKWKIAEKMAKLEVDRLEGAAKMKLATMIHVAGGGNVKEPMKYPPDSFNKQQPVAPQNIVAKIIPRAQQQQQKRNASNKPTFSVVDENQEEERRAKYFSENQQQQQQQQSPPPRSQQYQDANNVALSPETPIPTSDSEQQQQYKNKNNNLVDESSSASSSAAAIGTMEDHQKNVRDAYGRIQASQKAARAALRSDFSRAAVGAVPLSSSNQFVSSQGEQQQQGEFSSSSSSNNYYEGDGRTSGIAAHHSHSHNTQQQRSATRPSATLQQPSTSTSHARTTTTGASSSSSNSSNNQGGGNQRCPTGICGSSTCTCTHSLSTEQPPAPLLPPHSRPLPSLQVSLAPEDSGNNNDGVDDETH